MSEPNITKKQSIIKINEMYEGLSYFDQYGGSVLLFIVYTIIVFLVWSYSKIFINIQPIKDDWVNQRCKPNIIPFAGLINPPEGKTATEFTQENFTFCTQNILTSITGIAVAPFTYIFNLLNIMFKDLLEALQVIRQLFDSIRKKFTSMFEEVYGRISNTVFTFFPIIIKIKNAFEQTRAILVSGLYTSLGTYYTLQSLMGAILQIAVIVLIALAILVVVMWLCLAFPVAIAGTAAWAVCAAFLIIIIVFCQEKLHISVPGMPRAPRKPSCFDGETLLQMIDGSYKKIKNIGVGDILSEDGEVTAKLVLDAEGIEMYDLYGLIVSGSHSVKRKNNWIKVSKHPDAIKISKYGEPFIYCLNTKSKEIHIESDDIKEEIVFIDWDEIYDNTINIISNNSGHNNLLRGDIHQNFDAGFVGNTKIKNNDGTEILIKEIKPGTLLKNGIYVYGFVEINGKDLEYDSILGINNLNKDKTNMNYLDKTNDKMEKQPEILYHLLTNNGHFYINSAKCNDYNSLVELFL